MIEAWLVAALLGGQASPLQNEACVQPAPSGAAACPPEQRRSGPARARPRGAASLDHLYNSEDYPASAHRAGEGDRDVTVLLTVGIEGRVTGCRVTRSSRVASLDSAACRIMTRRARFWPALDSVGRPRVSTARHKVRWKMPPPIRPRVYS